MRVFTDVNRLSAAAARFLERRVKAVLKRRDVFHLALSGGSTPIGLYRLLAGSYAQRIPWQRMLFFWGDERFVDMNSQDSNCRTALDNLLEKVRVPAQHIFTVDTTLATPELSASAYEQTICRTLGGSLPSFDLILLGAGSDGHTASLFPGDSLLEETSMLVGATEPAQLAPLVRRITFTLPLINAARRVLFLVSGASKEGMVKAITEDPGAAARLYPAARVRARLTTRWYCSW